MKIRNGFVSNSSTSSFVIAGFYLPKNTTIEKVLEKLYSGKKDFPKRKPPTKIRGCSHKEIMDAEFCPTCGMPMWDENDSEEEYKEEVSEYVEDLKYSDGIDYVSDENFIGIKIARMSDGDGFSVQKKSLKTIMLETEKLKSVLGLKEDEEPIIVGRIEAC